MLALLAWATAATALLAGCGSGSGESLVARRCTSAGGAVRLKLVLTNTERPPRVVGRSGVVVEVVSSYHGGQMSFAIPHPSNAVCEISQQRSRDGTTTVVFKALGPTTVLFSSTYARATDLMMPAMFGRLIVR